MKGITNRQQTILDYINRFGQENGMAPTISEISAAFGISAATAFAHVKALQRKNLIQRSSKARSITLPGGGHIHHFSMNLSIPILGRISAGVPGEAEEHVEGHVSVDPAMLKKVRGSNPLFALTVTGESMRDAGILDGDLLIAQKTTSVNIGDVVVARVDDAVTVKYIYLTDGKWELRPANPDFKSRFLELDQLRVQGTAVGLIRSL